MPLPFLGAHFYHFLESRQALYRDLMLQTSRFRVFRVLNLSNENSLLGYSCFLEVQTVEIKHRRQ